MRHLPALRPSCRGKWERRQQVLGLALGWGNLGKLLGCIRAARFAVAVRGGSVALRCARAPIGRSQRPDGLYVGGPLYGQNLTALYMPFGQWIGSPRGLMDKASDF